MVNQPFTRVHRSKLSPRARTLINHSVDCGYYHFRSDGTKVKNKWDSYNVDEAIKELDSDDEDAEAARVKQLRKRWHEIDNLVEKLMHRADLVRDKLAS